MTEQKHSHYKKPVAHLAKAGVMDVYDVLDIFEVTNPGVQHALKKLLVPGGRGAGKDTVKDLNEAIDSIKRGIEIVQNRQAENTPQSLNLTETEGFVAVDSEVEPESTVDAGDAPEGYYAYESLGCIGCDLSVKGHCRKGDYQPKCTPSRRNDGKSVIFLKKV